MRKIIILLIFLCSVSSAFAFELMRLVAYQRDSKVDGWLASEMLDGVRAY